MYNIDSRTLKAGLGILLYSSCDNSFKTTEERTAYYYPIVLDMLVGVLNNDTTSSIEEAILIEVKRFYDDPTVQLFSELLYEEIRLIKKQFILAGFDPRLKYKLVSRLVGNTTIKLHAICMDLDATAELLHTKPETDSEDVSDAISEHPTYEQLESLYDKW